MKKIMAAGIAATLLTTGLTFTPKAIIQVNAAVAAQNPDQSIEQKASDIINTAISLKGKVQYNRYVYKPEAPYEFGCSGFIYYAFLQNGINLGTRATYLQATLGVKVPKDQLQPGDLVFFASNMESGVPDHNGIYIGDGKIIHNADETLDVIISDLNNGPSYYRTNYVYAKRVIPGFMDSAEATVSDKIVETAEALIGKATYGSYNEQTMTFNASGFTYYTFKKNGIDLKYRSVSYQATLGQPVKKENLQKGDLVFFSNSSSNGKAAHVGIYAGNNQVIHMAGSSTGVTRSFMGNKWYMDNYLTARRIQ